jgi:hypothetical protein
VNVEIVAQKCASADGCPPRGASVFGPTVSTSTEPRTRNGNHKALSSAFGYGTPAYLRYNEAATLDPSPLLTNVTVRAPVSSPPWTDTA